MNVQHLNIFNDLSEQIALHINHCGEEAHPSSWIESKQHVDYDLWYVYSGKIEIRIHEEVYYATKGDLVLFSPNIPYTAISYGGGYSINFTHFDFGLGNNFRILDNFKLSGIIESTQVPEEIRLFLDAYERYKHHTPMSGLRLKGSLMNLIAKIIELYSLGKYRGKFIHHASSQIQTINLQTLQPVFDFIHDHLHHPLRNGELAKLAGLSEKYFIYYFREALGVTPGQYIYQLKMNRARDLLYSHQYSVQQIAEMLGYADPYSFSKAFKKHYKVSPSKFI